MSQIQNFIIQRGLLILLTATVILQSRDPLGAAEHGTADRDSIEPGTAQPGAAEPVAAWDFEHPIADRSVGQATIVNQGPQSPEFPDFGHQNDALKLSNGASLRIPDDADGRFDFDNGDAITLEAWVDLSKMHENVYVIGKGRTQNPGVGAENQNWALRLRSRGGNACVNFLFRSRDFDDAAKPSGGQWHRWTSKSGFSAGTGWHHIAVTYRFGEPESIRGYLDGESVDGTWDMDGATKRPPVVDDDEVWIGSSMSGHPANSLDGMVDQVAVYRTVLSGDVLKNRFHYIPQPIGAPNVPPGKVVMQVFGPISGIASIPRRTGPLLTQWQQDEMALVRMPRKYDDWGIREDWGSTLLVRSTANVTLPAGSHRLLLRSRGMSRLWIDEQVVATTPPQKSRSSAHHVVDPLPEVPVPGMRPHAMNDREHMVDFQSSGKTHSVVMEAIVGGPGYRTEFGENCVAIQVSGNPMFTLLASHGDYPLTDEGWSAFTLKQAADLDRLDDQRRRQASAASNSYWQRRHEFTRAELLSHRLDDTNIDRLVFDRWEQANIDRTEPSAADAKTEFFTNEVQPILARHCSRCHGQKSQGGLSIKDRENLLTGGESEVPAIVPGNPEDSQLYELVSAAADDYRMPPKGDGLDPAELQTIRQWIAEGAMMPARPLAATVGPTDRIDDYAFLRRVYLDTVGVAPTLDELKRFLADSSPDRREHLVDRLLDDPRVADNWVGYWQDTLAENPNLLKPMLNNTGPFRWWIHEALRDNKPLDRFAMELIMMRGSRWDGGTAGFGVASQNDAPMAAKAFVIGSAFLGVQMKCARCHDAPYHQWTQGDLFQLAAMLERKPIKLPQSSTVPAAFFESQTRKSLIEATIQPGQTIQPHWPFATLAPAITGEAAIPDELLNDPHDSREQLAAQVTLSRRFAESLANRIWGRLMGLALVEPVDDWESNPPSDPDLLEYLTDQLIASNYDFRQLCRIIINSDAYQRTAIDRHRGQDPDRRFYDGPYRRRMTAEQIVDTAVTVVGRKLETETLTLDIEGTLPANNFLNFGVPQRAWEFTTLGNERDRPSLALPRIQAVADVLKAFGWRSSRPEPVSERQEAADLIQPAILANGTFGTWLTRLSDDSGLTHLALEDQPLESFVDDLFLTMLTREPTSEEQSRFVALLHDGYEQRQVPLEEIAAKTVPKRFRYVSWSNHLNTEANEIKVEMEELARQGPAPTRYLSDDWRIRAEDAVWALLNSPEMLLIP